uniref:spermatogenesis-associated protein 48 n=1 Tax=Scatophagus argus TaxID=75038 RepID=UPI001ED7E0B5|nr:spermatogenesis-associated protein 48 [Scatophagus argus]
MTAVLDSSRPFSTELHVIRQLNSSLYGAGGRHGLGPGREHSPFARFHAPTEHVTLAPLRDDVPLLDPCCGQLSAGAEVELGVKGRQKFIDFHHVASALWVPPGFSERPQTALNPSSTCVDLREDKAWNSRRIPDAAWRARLSGILKLCSLESDKLMSYEDVGWDRKLTRHLKAPQTPREKMADPVSECPSSRRYSSGPQLWQSVGAEWNRQQLRLRNDAKKPVSFCSGCPRSGQIPLYTGTVGSENMDNIDNMDEDFHPLTLKRSIIPPYTSTACRPTIPGYTGKAVYASSAAGAVVSVSSTADSSGTIKETPGATFGRAAPLSRMVTTVTPRNPFLRPAPPASHSNAPGHIRQSR